MSVAGIEKETVKDKVKEYFEIPTVKLVRGKIWKNFKITIDKCGIV